MPMDKSDKETKKKALDLMIVLGAGKPKGKPSDEEYDKEDSKMEDGKCSCSCCGKPCPYCEEDSEEEED